MKPADGLPRIKKGTALAALFIAIFLFYVPASAETVMKGAGPHFPALLYKGWADAYFKETGIKVDYRSTGSAEGIRLIEAKEVDFGATNAPLSVEELKAAGLYQFPVALRGILPVINLKGIEPAIGRDGRRLKLAPEVLSGIYLGEIKKWNDKKIAVLNPGIELPNENIIVVHHSDRHGSTWIITKYLSRVSRAWRAKVGSGLTVKWPVGIVKEGSDKVASFVKETPNSIGLVDYPHAFKYNLAYASLRNRDKIFVEPWVNNLVASAKAADWRSNPGYSEDITDRKGKDSWPIVGATYILIPLKPSNCENAAALLDFFDWTFRNGTEVAESNAYATLTKPAYDIIREDWTKLECGGKALRQTKQPSKPSQNGLN